jgi:hypothetical protein
MKQTLSTYKNKNRITDKRNWHTKLSTSSTYKQNFFFSSIELLLKIIIKEIEYLPFQLVSRTNCNALRIVSVRLVCGEPWHCQNPRLNLIIMATNKCCKPLSTAILCFINIQTKIFFFNWKMTKRKRDSIYLHNWSPIKIVKF